MPMLGEMIGKWVPSYENSRLHMYKKQRNQEDRGHINLIKFSLLLPIVKTLC